MGLELAKAWVAVRGDVTHLDQDLSQARDVVDRNIMSIQAAVLGVTGAFAATSAGYIRMGVAAAAAHEQTMIAFETMLGSASETIKLLDRLTEFAAKTPFEMPEILQAARGLVQFGERGDDLMETLRIVGNAAAGTSTQFGFLALIFNQIRGVGKLLTQDFRQLSTRGILSLQDLVDQGYAKSTQEAEQMVSSGKIGFEDLRKIFAKLSDEGGRFHNLMEKQSHSLSGLYSTLKDAYNISARIIATPLAEALKPIVEKSIEALDGIVDLTTKMPELTAALLTGATAAAMFAGSLVAARIAAVLLGATLSKMLIGSGYGIAIIAIGAAIGAAVLGVMRLVSWLQSLDMVQAALSRGVDRFWRAWENIKSGVAAILNSLIEKMTGISDWFQENFVTWENLGKIIEASVAYIINEITYFAEVASQVFLFVARNWQVLLEGMVDLAEVAWGSYIVDPLVEAWNKGLLMLGSIGINAFYGLEATWVTIVGNMKITWWDFMQFMLEKISIIPVKIAEVLNEMAVNFKKFDLYMQYLFDVPLVGKSTATMTYENEVAKVEAAAKASNAAVKATFQPNKMFEVFPDARNKAEKEMKDRLEGIEKARAAGTRGMASGMDAIDKAADAKKAKREAEYIAAVRKMTGGLKFSPPARGEKPPKSEEEEKEKEKEKKKDTGSIFGKDFDKGGFIGFAEYGKTLQSSILKNASPAEISAKEAQKHTEILGQQKGIQEQILNKAANMGGGLLGGAES